MNKHLNDDELANCLAFGPLNGMAEHLATCAQCRAELAQLRTTFAGFGDAARQAAVRDDWFWSRQRTVIAQRLRAGAPALRFRWALAGVVAMAALAASMLLQAPAPPTLAHPADEAADEALLQEIQTDVARQVPQALDAVQPIAQQVAGVRNDSKGENND